MDSLDNVVAAEITAFSCPVPPALRWFRSKIVDQAVAVAGTYAPVLRNATKVGRVQYLMQDCP